jgi:phage portal protein BeeE
MSQDISNASLSSISNTSNPFSISATVTDGPTGDKEFRYLNPNASQQYGYFTKVADLKSALIMKAIWTVGKGYTTDSDTKVLLEHITGYGKDTFLDVLFNMVVQMRIYGDAFAEIIRDPETNLLLNLKPLDPSTITIVVTGKGTIKRYEQMSKMTKDVREFQPEEILHFCNNRIADNVHGLSDIDALEKTLLADEEHFQNLSDAMRRASKPLIMFKLRTDNAAKISAFITKMDNAIRYGKNLYVPDDENMVSYEVVQLAPQPMLLEYQNALRNKFYRALGLPLVIFGAAGSTESGSKMEYLAHEQIFERDQKYIEEQLWNQLSIRIDLYPPVTMLENLQQDAAKDGPAQQINMQPSDVTAGSGR